MLLNFLFFIVWLLITLILRTLLVKLAPALARRRGALLVVGVVALALAWPIMQRISASDPARSASIEWPEGTRLPLPREVPPDLLARIPFTMVSPGDMAARATFVAAAERRPVALMALRLGEETTHLVQRYLVLHGDSLELVVDERRRSGNGELYALPLEQVVLAACNPQGSECQPIGIEQLPAGSPGDASYRILGRFPGDTIWALRF